MVRLAVFGTLFLTICTGVVVFVARQQPLPPRMAMLHLTDCAPPCWIGITPGVTPDNQVKARIQAAYGDTAIYRVHDLDVRALVITRVDDHGNLLQMTIQWGRTDQNTVEGFAMSTSGANLEIGDIAYLFGIPSGIATLPSEGGPTVPSIIFKNAVVDFWATPSEQFYAGKTYIHDGIGSIVFSMNVFSPYPLQHWRGYEGF